jgi:hypothetical protein
VPKPDLCKIEKCTTMWYAKNRLQRLPMALPFSIPENSQSGNKTGKKVCTLATLKNDKHFRTAMCGWAVGRLSLGDAMHCIKIP